MLQPLPHQKEAVEYLISHNGGILAMGPRVGKSLPSILAVQRANCKRVLIITVLSGVSVWNKWLKDQEVHKSKVGILKGIAKTKKAILEKEWQYLLCNYDNVKTLKIIESRQWDCIIFDESSIVSNGTAAVTRHCLKAVRKLRKTSTPVIMCLSGEPAPETPLQYAAQFILAFGSYFGHTELNEYIWTFWQTKASDPTKMEIRPNKLAHLQMIADCVQSQAFVRTMEGLGLGSPKIYRRVMVPLTAGGYEDIEWAEEEQKKDPDFGGKVFVGRMNQIGAGIDLQTKSVVNRRKLLFVLDEYKAKPRPILVVGHFVLPLEELKKMFLHEGIAAEVITGKTKTSEREAIMDKFHSGKLHILIGQSQVMKMSLDCSMADITYCISNSFSNDTRNQWELRTTNIRKIKPVEIVDICTEDTFDDLIVGSLRKKEKIAHSYLVGKGKNV